MGNRDEALLFDVSQSGLRCTHTYRPRDIRKQFLCPTPFPAYGHKAFLMTTDDERLWILDPRAPDASNYFFFQGTKSK
jgi:hypothetical protein